MSVFNRTALAVALLAVAPLASAATDPASAEIDVSITITNSCILTAEPLNFGTRDGDELANDIEAATTLTLDCSAAETGATIAFNNGNGTGATFDSRKMKNSAGDTINYGLYIDAGYTKFAGDGTNGSTIAIDADGSAQVIDIYGRVFSGQGPKPVGDYTDTVTATVTF